MNLMRRVLTAIARYVKMLFRQEMVYVSDIGVVSQYLDVYGGVTTSRRTEYVFRGSDNELSEFLSRLRSTFDSSGFDSIGALPFDSAYVAPRGDGYIRISVRYLKRTCLKQSCPG